MENVGHSIITTNALRNGSLFRDKTQKFGSTDKKPTTPLSAFVALSQVMFTCCVDTTTRLHQQQLNGTTRINVAVETAYLAYIYWIPRFQTSGGQ